MYLDVSMSKKKQIPVNFDGVAGNEQTILKLIFSVSERAGNRNTSYALQEDKSASLVICGECCDGGLNEHNQLVVCICDKHETLSELSITRPLIATRVLSSLDRLVQTFNLLESATESNLPGISHDDGAEARGGEDIEESVIGSSSSTVEFSISEEEASELAIIYDDSLSNPANIDELKDAESVEYSDNRYEIKPLTTNEVPGESEYTNKDRVSGTCQSALVVDDRASVRKQLEIELQLFEVHVDYAEDSDRAMDILSQKKYDVVFLDVVLPDGDGFEICKSIKAQQSSKKTKVIMLTGKASHADKVRGSLAGCDAYLIKPVWRATFQSTAKKFLKPVDNVEIMEA